NSLSHDSQSTDRPGGLSAQGTWQEVPSDYSKGSSGWLLKRSIVLTVQSAQSSVWQTAIHSFTVQAPVANHLLSGQP
ncbi:MAG: hypothetical protein ACYCT0_03065, partial [Sulfobacillus sp.]